MSQREMSRLIRLFIEKTGMSVIRCTAMGAIIEVPSHGSTTRETWPWAKVEEAV
jgi:hypothetical protein